GGEAGIDVAIDPAHRLVAGRLPRHKHAELVEHLVDELTACLCHWIRLLRLRTLRGPSPAAPPSSARRCVPRPLSCRGRRTGSRSCPPSPRGWRKRASPRRRLLAADRYRASRRCPRFL